MEAIIYNFPHAPEIYADEEGNFFRHSDRRPIPKIYHAGRIAVRDGNRIYGIKRLRKAAIKSAMDIIDAPF